jgi:hypothetical protein
MVANRHWRAPTTEEEWWALAANRRGHLVALARRVGGDDIRLGVAIDKRDAETAARLLNAVWHAAPDDPRIHYWSGWRQLCDLCSEAHLILPPAEKSE